MMYHNKKINEVWNLQYQLSAIIIAHNSDFHMSNVITYDISKEQDMCIKW